MNNYKLYVHICPNGKRYYGITKQEPKRRWSNGHGYKDNQYFTRAINKYGWDNIEHIILFDSLTEFEAKELEQYFIQWYNTTNKEYGYNICLGGDGTNGYKHTEEWKKEHSERMSGKNNPMFGKNIKDYMTEENYEKWKNKKMPSFEGRTHTEKAREKIGDAERGIKNHRAISIICLTTKKIFFTTRDGAKFYNCDHSGISKCCRGKYKSCGTFNGQKLVWRYLNYKHNKIFKIKAM